MNLLPPKSLERQEHMRPLVPIVVMQHLEEAVHLRHVRSTFMRSPHVRLLQLARLDDRIAAHLDGVAIAGDDGVSLAQQALEQPGIGEVFLATVRAIEDRDSRRLDKLLAIAETIPACRAGFLSAFGWVSASQLQGITKVLLESASPWRREVGLAACAMHGVDSGPALSNALRDSDAGLRARAFRVAGRIGRRDLTDACLAALSEEDSRCAFEAARAALLLGDRIESLRALEALATDLAAAGRAQLEALSVVLKVSPPQRAQAMLASIEKGDTAGRKVIGGIAIAGDPHYVPWLIAEMSNPKLARLAGEAFSFITGVDLALPDFELKPLEGLELGPNDNAADSNVDMDEDDGLPWPDPEKVAAWWRAHGARFVARTRYFMGDAPTPAKCLEVLKTGCQRQRIAAAEYRTLLTPGTALFNTAAPTWRQRRLLAGLG